MTMTMPRLASPRRPHRRSRRLVAAALLAVLLSGGAAVPHRPAQAAGQGQGATPGAVPPRQALIPADGRTYYGVQLSWAVDSPAAYATRLGKAPMVYGDFVAFPLSRADRQALAHKVAAIAALHGMLMLTLMPNGGLATVSEAALRTLGRALATYNRRGVPVFVRFAHEMNGSWYAWGQQPAAYVRAFRRVATAVHRDAPRAAMVWAPSYGGGYPFTGGRYAATPGSPAYAALDTTHDGRLTPDDDPYAPYYPGDAYVDWVGLTDYYWGTQYPWGRNEVPPAHLFVQQLAGTYRGALTEGRRLPDFYATYAVGHAKPFVLAETAALYNPTRRSGAPDAAIKLAWARQVFAPALATRFPRFKMVLWLEADKYEPETHSLLDWTVTCTPAVVAGFRAALPARLVFAPWHRRPTPGRTGAPQAGCPAPGGAR